MASDIAGKNVLFLVKSKANIATAATFLDRREINTYIATDLKEAIKIMDNTPPDFLCLSINYPHPKVLNIPKLISSTFGVETIVLSEKQDRKTDMTLSQASSRNVLYGAVSGPSLLMKIRKVLKEKSEEERFKNTKQTSDSQKNQGAQVIKSSEPRKKEKFHLQTSKEDIEDKTLSGGENSQKGPMIFTSEGGAKGPSTYNPQAKNEESLDEKMNKALESNAGENDLLANSNQLSEEESKKAFDPFGAGKKHSSESPDFNNKASPFEKIDGAQSLEEALKKESEQGIGQASGHETEQSAIPEEQSGGFSYGGFSYGGFSDNASGLFGASDSDQDSDSSADNSQVAGVGSNTQETPQARPPSVAEQVAQMNAEKQNTKDSGYVRIDQQISEGKKPSFTDGNSSKNSETTQGSENSNPADGLEASDIPFIGEDLFAAIADATSEGASNGGSSTSSDMMSAFNPFGGESGETSSSQDGADKNSSNGKSIHTDSDYKEHNLPKNETNEEANLEKPGLGEGVFVGKSGESNPNKNQDKLGEGVFVGKKGEIKNPFEGQKMAEPKKKMLTEQDLNYFRNSIDLAIKQTCDLTDKDIIPIQKTERLGFIPVNSGKYQGYITVGITEEQSLRSTLLSELSRNITENLTEMGEEIFTEEAVIIDIFDPELIEWAKKSGQIILRSQHKNSEMIISYISKERALPIIVEASTDMAAIDVIDIEPDKNLEFETYLHLPNNNKFIKYGKTGGTLSEKQLDRLKKKGNGRLHIKKKDDYNYKKSYIESEVQKDLKKFKKAN